MGDIRIKNIRINWTKKIVDEKEGSQINLKNVRIKRNQEEVVF
jgi:hypothetical protein